MNFLHKVADLERTGFSGQAPSLLLRRGIAPVRGLPPMSKGRTHSPNQVWSLDIIYLTTTVRGVWLYL